ncbi:uncharacterized protein DEA37_0010702 [Paragonimus westermani]|uniref:Uncharacterized protein n=1 Tax=Paragonimus westermani TaxID=34504 RepID=A0A5J4NQC6_9TREM|nr:uncharacterized protein DEA37_0010702 [Paragonimus westermani]
METACNRLHVTWLPTKLFGELISPVFRKLDATVPVLAVCGGTDLNEDVYNVDYFKVMTKSVQRSRAVIVFTQSMLTRFQEFWPDYKGLLKMIPQAVNVNRELAYRDLETHVNWLTKRLGVELTRYFVIVGRLRPVKDPQFALQPFIEWNSKPVTVLNQKTDEQLSRPYHHHLIYIGSVVSLLGRTENDHTCIQTKFSASHVKNNR